MVRSPFPVIFGQWPCNAQVERRTHLLATKKAASEEAAHYCTCILFYFFVFMTFLRRLLFSFREAD